MVSSRFPTKIFVRISSIRATSSAYLIHPDSTTLIMFDDEFKLQIKFLQNLKSSRRWRFKSWSSGLRNRAVFLDIHISEDYTTSNFTSPCT